MNSSSSPSFCGWFNDLNRTEHRLSFLSSPPVPPNQEYSQFFKRGLGRSVSWGERMEFINGWYILLIVSDMFTIIGSFIKIGIESKVMWGNVTDKNPPLFSLVSVAFLVIHNACCRAEFVVIRHVRDPAGNLHSAGVGGSHPLPQLLSEIQCRWNKDTHTNEAGLFPPGCSHEGSIYGILLLLSASDRSWSWPSELRFPTWSASAAVPPPFTWGTASVAGSCWARITPRYSPLNERPASSNALQPASSLQLCMINESGTLMTTCSGLFFWLFVAERECWKKSDTNQLINQTSCMHQIYREKLYKRSSTNSKAPQKCVFTSVFTRLTEPHIYLLFFCFRPKVWDKKDWCDSKLIWTCRPTCFKKSLSSLV